MWILVKDKKAFIRFADKTKIIEVPYEEWTQVIETKDNIFVNGKEQEK